jgi:two-component system NtrC family sensor kinase
VDELRELGFGTETFHGKPLGTVTVFLKGVRVATNVLGPDQTRAIGTRVTDVVQQEVLEDGRSWSDRAWVVDAWYLSGYEPLRDPEGNTIGMLYVGLLEAPYMEMRRTLVFRFLLAAGLMCILACGGALLLVRRITRPLENLSRAADRIAFGDSGEPAGGVGGYSEIVNLSEAFADMQRAIAERDRQLRGQNQVLEETNEKL